MKDSDSPVSRSLEFFLRLAESDGNFRSQYKPRDHARLRAEIWKAAAEETESLHWEGKAYEPLNDVRVRWMLEWCDVIAGTRRHIDNRLTSSVEFVTQRRPPMLSGRERAAGAHLETLAQGS